MLSFNDKSKLFTQSKALISFHIEQFPSRSTHTDIYTDTQTHTHMHTPTHPHTHTHTHTHTRTHKGKYSTAATWNQPLKMKYRTLASNCSIKTK